VVEASGTEALVGRSRQLANAQAWIDDLAAGRGRTLIFEGEPGIGKSSMLRVLADRAESAGCQVMWAACDELSQAFSLRPLLDALDARSSPASRRRIEDMLRADNTPGNRIDLSAAAAEWVLAQVDEACATAPTMLAVDDIQWADATTVMTIGRLTRTSHRRPLLLVCTGRPLPRRPDILALRRVVPPANLLRLRGLSATEVASLVTRTVGGSPSPGLLRLAESAGGNPLYLTELLAALKRAGALSPGDGMVEVTGDRTPDSLSAAIADRLDFLPGTVREIVRAAALLGVSLSVSELAVVSGCDVSDLLPLLDEAILAGVLRDDGHELAFRHPLIRAALYEGMPIAVRAAWHREAARKLAEDGAPTPRVARQLLPAADEEAPAPDDWAVCWLAEAAQYLVAIAPNATIKLMRWALRGSQSSPAVKGMLACRLADALYRVGEPADAAAVATSAVESLSANGAALSEAAGSDLLIDLYWTLTSSLGHTGRIHEAVDALERALDAPGVEDAYRARLLVLKARSLRALGQLEAAAEAAQEALVEATAKSDRWAIAWSLSVLTVVLGVRGEAETSLPMFERGLAVTQDDPALGDLRLLLLLNQSVALGDLDRYDEAVAAALQVRALADKAGNAVRRAQAQTALGELLFETGRWDEALAEFEVLAGMTKDLVVECVERGVAAAILLHRGEPQADRHLAGADELVERMANCAVSSLMLARSLSRERDNDIDQALAILVAGLTTPDNEETEDSAELLPDAVRLALDVDDADAASEFVNRAAKYGHGSPVPHRQAIAWHCEGLLQRDQAKLLRAADLYLSANRPLPRAQALEAAGVALAEGNDLTEARTRFTDAYAIYADLGAAWDLARMQQRFRSYGIRRGPHSRHRRARQGWESLTPTEVSVVRLVAEGMSNPQVAAQMFLSRRTVQTHVSHILSKLNLQSRIEIAREAARQDLDRLGGDEADDEF
jgi:DNA-binding CsgD family transcriptional regulator